MPLRTPEEYFLKIIIEQAQFTVKVAEVFGGGVQENLFCAVLQGDWFIIIDAVVLEGIKWFAFVEWVEGADEDNIILLQILVLGAFRVVSMSATPTAAAASTVFWWALFRLC